MPIGISAGLGGYVAPAAQSSITTSPAVMTSTAAANHLGDIQTEHANISQGINVQADKNLQNKVDADTAAKEQADKAASDKAAADKSALDHKQADIKMAVLGNTSPTPSKVGTTPQPNAPTITNDVPYGNGNTNWRQVTLSDGSNQVVTKTTGPGGAAVYTPVSQTDKSLQDNKDQLAQESADFKAKGDAVSKTISDIANGVIPLNAGEQAQVNGLQASFQQLINQQLLANQSAVGGANLRGYQKGAAEYDPNFQVSTIGSIVTAGINKVADLNIKMAGEVAKLTQSFRDNDIKSIKDSWDVYTTASKDRQAILQKTIDEAQTQIKDANDKAEKDRTYNLDVQKFQETKDKDAFDRAYKTEQQKIDAFKAGMGPQGVSTDIPSVHMDATGKPDPVSQQATFDSISKKYGPMTAISIKGLTTYDRLPTDWSVRPVNGKGLSRADAVALAQQMDPTYSETQAPARQAYMKSLQSGTIYQAVQSANKGINHLISFANTVSKLQNIYPFSSLNTASQAARRPFDNNLQSNMSDAKTLSTGLASEFAKFFKGTGTADVTSINEWAKSLDTGANAATLHGTVQGAIDLLAGQIDVMNQAYITTMGKAPEGSILQPAVAAKLSILKNQGYTVDIPGVNYTDKDAYIKYAPDAQENMNTAVERLHNAGLPLTPENILQMAQSL